MTIAKLTEKYIDEFEEDNVAEQTAAVAAPLELIRSEISREVSQWKLLKRLKESTETSLQWWGRNENAYPYISKLAKQLLCIPASSAASERTFSSSGNTLTKKRNRLDPEMVRELVFLKDAIDKVAEHKAANN